jgi:cob(I)alamin adenosyltransferase
MFYTKKENGRISKNPAVAEALVSLDEINSFLGLCKVQSAYLDFKLGESRLAEIVHEMQKNLFIIQAELNGADETIKEAKVKELEGITNDIDMELPPMKSFFIPGGPAEITKWQQSGAGLSAIFDIACAIAGRAERRVAAVMEEMLQPPLPAPSPEEDDLPNQLIDGRVKEIGEYTVSYLNRLSSALYALARYSNHKVGIMEEAPNYR